MDLARDQKDEGLKVFVSYSRQDEAFVRELTTGLELIGFKPFVDQHDIAAGEQWELRLGRLIEGADTVVFVISPESVKSPRCAWEVDRTVALNKKLLPIVWQPVEEEQVPSHLKRLNYIFFNQPHSFAPSLVTLAGALKTDVDWLRNHTQIGESSLRWQSNGKADAFLMRGVELSSALDWLRSQPKFAPEPTLLMREYIQACQDGEATRANSERQRLEEVAAAQLAREKALHAAEEANQNRARIRMFAFSSVSIVAALAGWQAWRAEMLREQDGVHLKQALAAEASAKSARERAELAKVESEDLRVLAEKNRAVAENQRVKAEAEAEKAKEALRVAMRSVETVTVFRQRITAPNADRESILADLRRDSTAMIASLQEIGGGRELDDLRVEMITRLSSDPSDTFTGNLALAERGNVSAMAKVGAQYFGGVGVARNVVKAFEWIEKAAKAGDVASQASIGVMYFKGDGTERDYVRAREWFEKAVAAGNASAMRYMGVLYSQGSGVTKDIGKAREWYEKAAALGNAEAINNLGVIYATGQGVPKDYAKAFELYAKSAAAGYAVAMANLSWMYIDGNGVPKDYSKATEWMEKAAQRGYDRAYGTLGALYLDARDYAKARPWLEKAAASGNSASMNSLAVMYAGGQGVQRDYEQARQWFEKAASAGNSAAMRNLGRLYEDGVGVQRDYAQALAWYEKASAEKDSMAMVYLGLLYQNGLGVATDYPEAMKRYEQAAAAGSAAGMNNIGSLYNSGSGVPLDFAKALEWYQKGAEAGSATSLRNLGWLYANGQGVAKDYIKAREFYEKAAAGGDAGAMRNLGWIYANGDGVPKDITIALQWLEKAFAAGDKASKRDIQNISIREALVAGKYAEALDLSEKAADYVEGEEVKAKSKPGAETVSALGDLSFEALLAGEPAKALAAADRALAILPGQSWIEMNRAHALMFLERTDEARGIYLAHKGEATGPSKRPWQKVVAEDFDQFRKAGHTHPLMTEMEQSLQD